MNLLYDLCTHTAHICVQHTHKGEHTRKLNDCFIAEKKVKGFGLLLISGEGLS